MKVDATAPAYPHGACGQQTGTGMDIRTKIAAGILASLLTRDYKDYHVAVENAVEATDLLIKELNK